MIIFEKMSAEKTIATLKANKLTPVYLLHGEEDYYIDEVLQYAEQHLLNEAEKEFNQTIFYGRDTDWATVVNACRRYPMFAEKQVVIIKEAQYLKDIEKLEAYLEKPLESTIFIIAHKEKPLDKRTKFYKLIDKIGSVLLSEKVKDYKLNEWLKGYLASKNLTATTKAIALLEENIGADLSRIVNEIEKLQLNLKGRNNITEDDVETFIGFSKEFNAFELQAAVATKNLKKALQIIQYFDANPKAGPIQMVIPALYASFSKIYSIFTMPDKSEQALKPIFYFNGTAVKSALETMRRYNADGIERILLLLHEYNLKSIGIGANNVSGPELMKEMVVKMII
jgi:DNA polymerase III subunit delta